MRTYAPAAPLLDNTPTRTEPPAAAAHLLSYVLMRPGPY